MSDDVLTTVSSTGGPRRRRVSVKALPQHNRVHNRAVVLQALFHQGAMSRADLARESGLTRPTVSVLVAELEADGIVAEIGQREDVRVGKPATLVEINPDAFHMIVLDLSSADRFVGAVVNLRGEVVDRADLAIDGAVREDAIARVIRLAERLSALTTQRILGIGVGSPGIVDDQGVVREALHLEWFDLPLRQRLADYFHLPVLVANDANVAALGVHTFREVPGLSLMVVTIEHGVGVGLIIGGSLVEGEQFSAGEIGHVTVGADGEGALCTCGRRGCLETVIGARYLSDRIAGLDEGARGEVLRDAGRALGVVAAPVISALNLNEVVLSGPSDLLDGPFRDAAVDTIKARTLSVVGEGLSLRTTQGDGDLVLLGGASLVLQAELGVS
ncbi:ROK family transcriptional regulator [Frondihabitans australicus]|uniref:Putative NBD/HSP70 family sugar kinase n=1 Tax=Frondihabitans australicus TaxID=386892 RepID=A0A495IHF4_9MICO|nr:ROK family transcriptional regulator [Frondihabitans australicus]RKR75432.1 putative NBD/HSP70 family sugar kinase [Frondihabitans australicus]